MQTIVYVLAKPNQQSLREVIVADLSRRNNDGCLNVISQKKRGRRKGWAKIKRKDAYGSLNVEWDGDAKTLIARAVTKGANRSDDLVGAFISYLLRRQQSRISSITLRTIQLQKRSRPNR